MMVLRYFDLPYSPSPTRGGGEERMQGKWTCLERFFGITPICVVWKSEVQFTGQQAAAARSIRKHLTDAPAVQFGRVGLATAMVDTTVSLPAGTVYKSVAAPAKF